MDVAMNFDPADVPEPLRYLIPLVLEWGIGDDGDRDNKVLNTPSVDLVTFTKAVDAAPQLLWDWLGSAPEDPSLTSEAYASFTEMTMAYDMALVVLQQRG
jgi:hypothetical protein